MTIAHERGRDLPWRNLYISRTADGLPVFQSVYISSVDLHFHVGSQSDERFQHGLITKPKETLVGKPFGPHKFYELLHGRTTLHVEEHTGTPPQMVENVGYSRNGRTGIATREPCPRIELSYLVRGAIREHPVPVGGPVERLIVEIKEHTVFTGAHIYLNPCCAIGQRRVGRGYGVFGCQRIGTPMHHDVLSHDTTQRTQ